jgi:hypothetical protein
MEAYQEGRPNVHADTRLERTGGNAFRRTNRRTVCAIARQKSRARSGENSEEKGLAKPVPSGPRWRFPSQFGVDRTHDGRRWKPTGPSLCSLSCTTLSRPIVKSQGHRTDEPLPLSNVIVRQSESGSAASCVWVASRTVAARRSVTRDNSVKPDLRSTSGEREKTRRTL